MTDGEPTVRGRMYESDRERINERRQGTETQADVIRRLLDGDTGEDAGVTDADVPEALRVDEETRAQLDRIEEQVGKVPERTAEELEARQR